MIWWNSVCSLAVPLTLAMLQGLQGGALASPAAAERWKESDFYKRPATVRFGDSWMKERWTGDETSYVKARKEVEAAFRTRASREQLLVRFTPTEPQRRQHLAVFRWAVAHWEAIKQAGARGDLTATPEVTERGADITYQMGSLPSPKVREWARIRALVEEHSANHPSIRPVVDRLHVSLPDDADVGLLFISCLLYGGRVEDQRSGLVALERVRRLPGANALVCQSYESALRFFLFQKTRQNADGDRAIQAAEAYIRMCPAKGSQRSMKEWVIRRIREIQRGG